MASFWGKHLMVDAGNCDREKIKSEENIKAFLTALVERIDMKAYGEPILAHFATHDPSKGGYTFVQMIETSLIDGHLVDATGDAYISVHSCKDFDNNDVLNVIHDYFEPKTVLHSVIYRQAHKLF
jgi:S-adenosylmethionine/arginine decarboxylase-like enzyme